jgi:hypothetical protein
MDQGTPQTSESVDSLILQLQAPNGAVEHAFSTKYGPVFQESAPMQKLIEQGNEIQTRLLPELKNPRIRNEIAIILGKIGDQNALPQLIEVLPTKDNLTNEESFSTMCLLHALSRLTGGVGQGSHENYTPECRKRWQAWYDSYKDYLYTPLKSNAVDYGRVQVDVEAKMAVRPTSTFREEHPRIKFEPSKPGVTTQAIK